MDLQKGAAAKWPVNDMTLRYNGIFDFDGMYAAMIDWAKGYNYIWNEQNYKHKVPSPKGAEQEWEWEMHKKINDFVIYRIHISGLAFDLREVDVEVDGKVKHLTNARIQLRITSKVEFDWQKKFGDKKKEGQVWAKMFGTLYMKMMQKEFEIQYWDNLYYHTYKLQAELKKYFDMVGKYHAW